MTAARRRDRHPVVAVTGLALLAIPGFALGVVAGVAWEEPGLLLDHLLGRTVDVPWGSVAEGGEGERLPVAEPAPEPRVVTRKAKPLPAVAAPAPKPPPSATRMRPDVLAPGGPAGRFAVQVGAFGESGSAERLAEQLRGKGFDVYVSPSAERAGAARWRVRVGPHGTREEAERAAHRLKAEEKLPTWVLDENAV